MIQAMVARPYICGARPRAGITERFPMLNEAGQPIVNNAGEPVTRDVAKYGLHALRHACASLWIERGMNPKPRGTPPSRWLLTPTAIFSPTTMLISARLKKFRCVCSGNSWPQHRRP